MSRTTLSAAAFAIAANDAVQIGAHVLVESGIGTSGRSLIAAAEPLEPGSRGLELSHLTLSTIREVVHQAGDASPARILNAAIAAANQALLIENRPLDGWRWDRRHFAGVTVVLIENGEAVVAQTPPSHCTVVQDRQTYSFPPLASWTTGYTPECDDREPDPLGRVESVTPRLHRTLVESGDLLVLGSTAIARIVARQGLSAGLVPVLRNRNIDAVLDAYAEIVEDHGLDDAFVAAVRIDKTPRRFGFRHRPGRAATNAKTWPAMAPRVLPDHPPRGARPTPRAAWSKVGVDLAHQAPERVAPQRQATPTTPSGRRQGPIPGAGSMRRYREESSLPPGLLASLPRGVSLRASGPLLALGLVAFVGFGGTSLAFERQQDQDQHVKTALATADASISAITADPGNGAGEIANAEQALVEARQAGASRTEVFAREQTLDTLRNQVWNIGRFQHMTRIGSLPAALGESPVRMLVAGGRLFLAGNGLYQVDPASSRLIEVLAPGTVVGDGALGPILAAESDGMTVTLADGGAVYQESPSGWQRIPIYTGETGEVASLGQTAMFNGALYSLTTDGRVTRYSNIGKEMSAQVWAYPADYPDLAEGRDLVVDERVHVLLNDGRILSFYQGILEMSHIAPVSPAVSSPEFFAHAPGSRALYLVEPGAATGGVRGRLIRFDPGGATQQFLAPCDLTGNPDVALAGNVLGAATDLAVIESTRMIYFISGNELWQAELPSIVT